MRLDATYTTPYQAHAMMARHASVAACDGDHVTVWTSHQMVEWLVTAVHGDDVVHVIGPTRRLVLVGASEVSRCRAPIAMVLGYRVVVIDPRREYLDTWPHAGCELVDDARRQRLALFDVTPAEVDRLKGPVGLDIGARTPMEIAVSIAADLVQHVRRPAPASR